jgi:hypothetical protein
MPLELRTTMRIAREPRRESIALSAGTSTAPAPAERCAKEVTFETKSDYKPRLGHVPDDLVQRRAATTHRHGPADGLQPTGSGEPSLIPVGAAIANAFFDATRRSYPRVTDDSWARPRDADGGRCEVAKTVHFERD